MTAEELKEKIEFDLLPGETDKSKLIVGTLKIACATHVSEEVFSRPELVVGIKESIRNAVMQRIYPDTRREFYEAIQEFMSWHYPVPEAGDPWTGPTMSKASAAREKLLKLARYQPHSTDEKKINQSEATA